MSKNHYTRSRGFPCEVASAIFSSDLNPNLPHTKQRTSESIHGEHSYSVSPVQRRQEVALTGFQRLPRVPVSSSISFFATHDVQHSRPCARDLSYERSCHLSRISCWPSKNGQVDLQSMPLMVLAVASIDAQFGLGHRRACNFRSLPRQDSSLR